MCRSVLLSVLAADEIDRWPNPGAHGQAVDLVGKPDPKPTALEHRPDSGNQQKGLNP